MHITNHAFERWDERVQRSRAEVHEFIRSGKECGIRPRWATAVEYGGHGVSFITNPEWGGVALVVRNNHVLTVITRRLANEYGKRAHHGPMYKRGKAVSQFKRYD
ncbi:MAG: hypothetical protein KGR26_01310 [Cyanobacteria bacterium REEB65]|nr:hypothetical protein [Cyanobacteria bacterium REEB65]